MKKKNKFDPNDWQGRRKDQVESNNWMLVVAITVVAILAISGILIRAII